MIITNKNIKKVRESMGKTRSEFAEIIGGVYNTIGGYERNERRVPKTVGIIITLVKKLEALTKKQK